MRAALGSVVRQAFAAPTLRATPAPSELNAVSKRFASHKQGGKSKNGRDSNPKYRGWKVGHYEEVEVGNVLLRQKGSKWHAGEGVGMGRDHTLFAKRPGFVFTTRGSKTLHGSEREVERRFVHIVDARPVPPPQDIR